MREATQFERENGPLPDREDFLRDILPGLQSVPVQKMAEVTGLTPAYCGMVRGGPIRAASEALGGAEDHYAREAGGAHGSYRRSLTTLI